MTRAHYLVLTLTLAFCAGIVPAQVPTGTPVFGSFGGGPDVINLANLNSHLDIPVVNKAGRGTNFTYDLSYDSSVWYPVTSGSTTSWQPISNWGWRGITEVETGYISYSVRSQKESCFDSYLKRTIYYYIDIVSKYVYHDSWGVPHPFDGTSSDGGSSNDGACTTDPWNESGVAKDGSGYQLNEPSLDTYLVVSRTGQVFNAPVNSTSGGGQFTDRNGNQITVNSSGSFYDTLSSTIPALTVAGSGTPTSPMTFTYTAPSGANAAYKMNYTQYTVKTYFNTGITEYGPTSVALVSGIVLPDNSQYSFSYEVTPSAASCAPLSGTTSCVTGRITNIVLPTGGQITYSYSGGSNGILSDGSAATLTRATPDGTWTYAQVKGTGAASTTTVTNPQGNVTTIQFQGIYETQRQVSNLLTTNTCYNGAASPCNATAIVLPITNCTVITTLPNNLQSKHTDVLNTFGMPTETDDYDYGPGALGALLRKTTITYSSLANITAFRQTVTTYNGAGTQVAQTTNNYDETTPTATSGLPQHVAVSGSRGNLTSVNQWVNTTNTNLTSHMTYYDTGAVSTTTAANAAVTTYNYSTCADAFPTSVSEPMSMSRSFAWNCTGGVLTQVTDENSQPTTTTYNEPFFWRPASQNFPDGGQTSWTYNSPTSTTTTTKMSASQNIVSTTLLDGLGRTSQTQLNSDPQGVDYTVTTYDALGRVGSAYNPTRCNPPTSNCGEPTWGITSYQYDTLSRSTSVTLQDGSVVTALYSSNTTTVTDPAGKKRQSTLDALGRMTQVTEDPGGVGYVTAYSYDALNNLTGVVQNTSRQRTYVFDSLSRLTSETNPESGTVNYKYDADSNCGNSAAGLLASKTDARSIRTCYYYDALNRLTGKNYSDGTPSAIFSYDASNPFYQSATNTIGRLVGAWTGQNPQGVNWTAFSYDSVGRVNTQWNCIDYPWADPCTKVLATSLQHDLAGNLTQTTYPSGRVITQQYSGAGLPTQVTFASFNGTAVGYNYLNTATYAPHGAPASLALGNGLTETTSYNQQLQLSNQQVASSVLTALNRSFGFTSGQNNGNVMNITDNLQPNRTLGFGYDSLNRISTAQANATSGPDCWAQQFGYDAWSNLLTASPTRSGCPMTALNIGVNAANQITNTGFAYDAAGNTLNDSTNTYVFDAENRITSINSGAATYAYGADGNRVRKLIGSDRTEYIYSGSQPIAEYKPATGDWSDYIYAGSRRLARADTYEDRIHTYGTVCGNCGWQAAGFAYAGIVSYVIQTGDLLVWRQWQTTGTHGGIGVWFTDGSVSQWVTYDQDGQQMDNDGYQQVWHYRRVDMSQHTGKTISQWMLVTENTTSPGYWEIYYQDVALVSKDGTVHPIYAREQTVSLTPWASSGMTGVGYEVNHCCDGFATPDTTTNYYHGDHLGSARLVTSVNGYPTWSATYLPFGQEWNPQMTVNHYKFTGDERDAETSLDHTLFRQYSSQFGRWHTPDPAGLAAVDPTNPQSWNRYAYVNNNPLRAIDPTGLECVWDDGSYDSLEADVTGTAYGCGSQGGTWIDHSFFADFGLPDWSGSANGDLAAVASGIQAGFALVQTGSGLGGWMLVANGGAGPIDWSLLVPPAPTLTYNQQAISAIHNKLRKFPTVCGKVGGFVAGEIAGFGAFGQVDENGKALPTSFQQLLHSLTMYSSQEAVR